MPTLVVGWREWVALPELGVTAVRAKLDSGARSSSLHVADVEPIERDGAKWVRFRVRVDEREPGREAVAEAPVVGERRIRSSSGHVEPRLVVRTTLVLGPWRGPIDLTLTRRDSLGHRMLLGRRALRGRCLVDPSRSYVSGRPGNRRKNARAR